MTSARWILIIGLIFVMTGCARTKPSRFYTLSAIQINQSKISKDSPSIGIGPINIPDYLDRPQIVTRNSENQIHLGDFDKWAGSLKENILDVMSKNLSVLLNTSRTFVFPWRVPVQYQITFHLFNFETAPEGKTAWIDVQWAVWGNSGKKLLLMRRTRLSSPVSTTDYDSIVAAQSQLLQELSRQIAKAVKEF